MQIFDVPKVRKCLSILGDHGSRMSAEAKYFLIRTMYCFGLNEVAIPVKALVKSIGLSDQVMSKAKKELFGLGLLISCPQRDENKKSLRGRPISGYKISQRYLDRIIDPYRGFRDDQVLMMPFKEIWIGLLLWPDGSDYFRTGIKKVKKTDKGARRQYSYNAATRLLIATLYLHADQAGAINDLSLAKLCRLIGVSMDRLHSQFDIIRSLGFLLARVPGVTGKKLFGRSTGSIYVNPFKGGMHNSKIIVAFNTRGINGFTSRSPSDLVHLSMSFRNNLSDRIVTRNCYLDQLLEYFKKDDGSEKSNLFSFKNSEPYLKGIKLTLEEKGLYYNANWVRGKPVALQFVSSVDDDVFNWVALFHGLGLLDFFDERPDRLYIEYFNEFIYSLASRLLSQNWDILLCDKVVFNCDVLEYVSSKVVLADQRKEKGDIKCSALVMFIYCISYQLSLMIKSLLTLSFGEGSGCILSKSAIVILPVQNSKSRSLTKILLSISPPNRLREERLLYFDVSLKGREVGFEMVSDPGKLLKVWGYNFDFAENLI